MSFLDKTCLLITAGQFLSKCSMCVYTFWPKFGLDYQKYHRCFMCFLTMVDEQTLFGCLFFFLQSKAMTISSDPRCFKSKKTTTMVEEESRLAPSVAEEPGNQSTATILLEESSRSMKSMHFSTEVPSSGGLNLNVPVTESLGKQKVTDQSDIALCDLPSPPDDSQSSYKRQKKISDTDEVTEISDYNRDKNIGVSDENMCIIASASLNDSVEHAPNKLISGGTFHDEHENSVHDNEAKDVMDEAEIKQSSNSMEEHVQGMQSLSEWKPLEKELYLKGVEMFGKNRYWALCFVSFHS